MKTIEMAGEGIAVNFFGKKNKKKTNQKCSLGIYVRFEGILSWLVLARTFS